MTRIRAALVAAGLAAFWAQTAAYRNHTPLDDAYITFRYAHNLAKGFGPVFNVGERVDGYTNFLWMLILSGFERLGLAAPVVAPLLGVLFGSAVIILVGRARVPGVALGGAAAALLLGCMHPLAYHGVMGLETALFTLFLTAAFVRLVADGGRAGAMVAWLLLGAALTRPEGVLFGLVLVASGAVLAARDDDRPWSRRLIPFVAPAAVYAAYLAWRTFYYGHLLPNTYFAKQAPLADDVSLGLPYVGSYLVSGMGLVALVAGFVLIRRARALAIVGLSLLVTASVYAVWVGGDHFPHHRFFVPVLPAGALLIAGAVGSLGANRGRTGWGAAAMVVVALAAYGAVPGLRDAAELRRLYEIRDHRWRLIGRGLGTAVPAGTTIATSPVGAIGYYSRLPVVDILGLTDAHIARVAADPRIPIKGHQKHDGAYVLSRRPTYLVLNNGDLYTGEPDWRRITRVTPGGELVLGGPLPRPYRFELPFERDIVETPAFQTEYRADTVRLADGCELLWWRRIDDAPVP